MAQNGINKMILLGRLGQDPEVRYMPQGGAVANLTVATSESWRDKQTSEQREKTEWHRVSIYGKLAEVAGEYLRKGAQVYLEGQLQTRKWQDQSGQDRYTTEIVVQGYNGVMQMLGGAAGGGQNQANAQNQPPRSAMQPANHQPNHRPEQNQQASEQQNINQHRNQSGPESGWPQNANEQGGQRPQYNEPPMDFDDDIPFRLIYSEHKNLHHCI